MHPRVQANLNGTWQIPDNVDVTNFDFSWKPDLYDPPFIHQFGTQWQRDGGPKYIVEGAIDVKFVDSPKVIALSDRNRWRILHHSLDLNSFDFSWHPSNYEPYTHVFGGENFTSDQMPCLEYIGQTGQKKYHDYPKIKFNSTKWIDVVFLSNGETNEDVKYKKLCHAIKKDIKWVRGIKGREQAIKRCAELSETDWVLVFPAKIEVYPTFNFNWIPSSLGPKRHLIFYADNPVNGLCYGHMAPVAYNCEIVRNTNDYDLDFTMSGEHTVIPISAGIAKFNENPVMTWRTAFREVIKLKYSTDHGDIEADGRLQTWLSVAHGDFAKFCLYGAYDAIQYYHKVGGELSKLKRSFDWQWLDQHAKQLGHNFNTV